MAAGSLETKNDVIKEQIVLACGALVGHLELVLEPGSARTSPVGASQLTYTTPPTREHGPVHQ